MPATSLPAAGSLTPMQPTMSPAMAGTRNSRRNSSLPKRASAGVHMSVCTPMAIGTPPQFDVAQRLGHRHGIRIVEARAAKASGLVRPSKPRLPKLLEHLMGGEDLGRFPFIDVGVDLSSMKRLRVFWISRCSWVNCMDVSGR
jgi:hypothetical protein